MTLEELKQTMKKSDCTFFCICATFGKFSVEADVTLKEVCDDPSNYTTVSHNMFVPSSDCLDRNLKIEEMCDTFEKFIKEKYTTEPYKLSYGIAYQNHNSHIDELV